MVLLVEGQGTEEWETTIAGRTLGDITDEVVNGRFVVHRGIDGIRLTDTDQREMKFAVSVSLSNRGIWFYDKKYQGIVGELVTAYGEAFGKMEVVERYVLDR